MMLFISPPLKWKKCTSNILYYFDIPPSKTRWFFFCITYFRVAALVSKTVDTTGPSVFSICKTLPSWILGLVTGLPDIPTTYSASARSKETVGLIISQMHGNLNSSAHAAVPGTPFAHLCWDTHQHLAL